LNSNCD